MPPVVPPLALREPALPFSPGHFVDAALSRKWLQVAAASALINTSYGTMSYSFSVLVTRSAAGGDLGTGGLAIAFGAGLLVSGIAAIGVGTIADLFGVRRLLAGGSVFGLLGLVLFSFCNEAWQAALVMTFVLGPAMAATFYEPIYVLMNRWFTPGERPRAYGVLTLLSGVSITIFTPLTQYLVEAGGWRTAVRVLGIILVVVGLAVAAILREPPGNAQPGTARLGFVREMWLGMRSGNVAFWSFSIAFFFAAAAQGGFQFHFIALLESRGFDKSRVAEVIALTGLLSLPLRLLLPASAGRISSVRLLAGCLLLVALAAWVGSTATEWWQVWVYVLIYGSVFGAVFPLRALVTAERFSGEFFGRLIGVQALFLAFARAIGPAAVGLGGESREGYEIAFKICALVLVASCVAMVIVLGRAAPAEKANPH